MVMLGERLKAIRIKNGLTQKQVAEFLKIAPNSFQRFEYGKDNPSLDNIIKLCNYFSVSADYLLGIGVYADEQRIIENRDRIADILYEELPEAKLIDMPFFYNLSDFAFLQVISAFVTNIDFSEGIKIKYYFE